MHLQSGSGVGRYTIVSRVGMGPTSVVYHAVEAEQNRAIALKFLARALTFNAYARAQFQQDVEALHQVAHPNIVPILHVGQHREQVYVAMPLLAGGSLAERLSAEPMPHLAARDILLPIAAALDAAHAAGQHHLNIKPSNILFHEGEPHLSDFALGDLASANSGFLTGEGFYNASYASPEQCEGGDVDGRSDIYSLAILYFQMVTGRLPYRAGSAELIAKMHHVAPIPKLENSLDVVFVTGLAKRKEDRPASASDLLALVPDKVEIDHAAIAERKRWWQRIMNQTRK